MPSSAISSTARLVAVAAAATTAASQPNQATANVHENRPSWATNADKNLAPEVTVVGTAEAGHTTYALSLRPNVGADVGTIYTIYGDSATQMAFPPCFQAAAPFGTDIGGVNPQFFAYSSAAASDSWLSVGVTGGNNDGAIASIGVPFARWTETSAMAVDDGAVFWMDPTAAPTVTGGKAIQIAQLTTLTGVLWTAVVNAQGKNKHLENHKDWEDHGIVFSNNMNAPPPPPPPSRPVKPLPPAFDTPSAAGVCTNDVVSATFDQIPTACCADGDDCSNGFPTSCSADCGALILPFWHSCEGFMHNIPGYGVMDYLWENFVTECRTGTPVTSFRCETAELLPIALDCSSTDMDAPDFCSSDCAKQVLPMVQQCATRPAFETAIQLLVGRPVGKLVSNCVVELAGQGMDSVVAHHRRAQTFDLLATA